MVRLFTALRGWMRTVRGKQRGAARSLPAGSARDRCAARVTGQPADAAQPSPPAGRVVSSGGQPARGTRGAASRRAGAGGARPWRAPPALTPMARLMLRQEIFTARIASPQRVIECQYCCAAIAEQRDRTTDGYWSPGSRQ